MARAFLPSILRRALEKRFSERLGVAVQIENIDVSMTGGSATLEGLSVPSANNPEQAALTITRAHLTGVGQVLKGGLPKSLSLEGVAMRLHSSENGDLLIARWKEKKAEKKKASPDEKKKPREKLAASFDLEVADLTVTAASRDKKRGEVSLHFDRASLHAGNEEGESTRLQSLEVGKGEVVFSRGEKRFPVFETDGLRISAESEEVAMVLDRTAAHLHIDTDGHTNWEQARRVVERVTGEKEEDSSDSEKPSSESSNEASSETKKAPSNRRKLASFDAPEGFEFDIVTEIDKKEPRRESFPLCQIHFDAGRQTGKGSAIIAPMQPDTAPSIHLDASWKVDSQALFPAAGSLKMETRGFPLHAMLWLSDDARDAEFPVKRALMDASLEGGWSAEGFTSETAMKFREVDAKREKKSLTQSLLDFSGLESVTGISWGSMLRDLADPKTHETREIRFGASAAGPVSEPVSIWLAWTTQFGAAVQAAQTTRNTR